MLDLYEENNGETSAWTERSDSECHIGANRFQVSPARFVDWRWQMAHQIRTVAEARAHLTLTAHEEAGFAELGELFNAGITPYYSLLMQSGEELAADHLPSCPIRRQAMPLGVEAKDPVGMPDPLDERGHSPVKEVVHVYPDRVAFCVAQICPVYCRYCYRKRRDEESGLHFNRRIIDNGLNYINDNKSIRDVLITGGDPLLASDLQLVDLVGRLRSIPHVEIIRFGTRTPVTLPYRITKKLCQELARFHPIWVNTHFNCAEELSIDAQIALSHLVDHGFPVGNQSVMLKGVNDDVERMKTLCLRLVKHRVRPYYVFHAHLVQGTQHLRVSLDKGLEIMRQLRGKISGFAIPQFIVDTPSGKIPMSSSAFIKRDGNDALFENQMGEIFREKHAYFD